MSLIFCILPMKLFLNLVLTSDFLQANLISLDEAAKILLGDAHNTSVMRSNCSQLLLLLI